eukprot:9868902-Lingulodinium_polyedra.AAC.1
MARAIFPQRDPALIQNLHCRTTRAPFSRNVARATAGRLGDAPPPRKKHATTTTTRRRRI